MSAPLNMRLGTAASLLLPMSRRCCNPAESFYFPPGAGGERKLAHANGDGRLKAFVETNFFSRDRFRSDYKGRRNADGSLAPWRQIVAYRLHFVALSRRRQ
jgi:hypothetical protein